jgi:hypothetical protein
MASGLGYRLPGMPKLLGDRANALLIDQEFSSDQFVIFHRQHPLPTLRFWNNPSKAKA